MTEPTPTAQDLAFGRVCDAVDKETAPPPEPGFDADLAGKVLGHIEVLERDWRSSVIGTDIEPPAHIWDQGDWRHAIRRQTAPTACGTAMCYAGWTAELAGQWLLSPQEMHAFSPNLVPYFASLQTLVLAGDCPHVSSTSTVGAWLERIESSCESYADFRGEKSRAAVAALREALARYSPDTLVTGVAQWAAWRLGMGDDPLGMFDGNNSLEKLQFIVRTYAEYGTDPTVLGSISTEDRERYLECEVVVEH